MNYKNLELSDLWCFHWLWTLLLLVIEKCSSERQLEKVLEWSIMNHLYLTGRAHWTSVFFSSISEIFAIALRISFFNSPQ